MKLNPLFWRLLLHLPKLARLVLRLLKDKRVPLSGKIVFCLSIAYWIWPLDLIPALLQPVIGTFDDVALLLVGLRYLFYKTPAAVLQEHLSALNV
ncbi:MAG: DUF1232 domain-containing protein, partial [Acidobacteriota bacterium]